MKAGTEETAPPFFLPGGSLSDRNTVQPEG